MKVGEKKSDEAMQLIASVEQYLNGKLSVRHPRNGLCVIERPEGAAIGADWVVTKCERPDP